MIAPAFPEHEEREHHHGEEREHFQGREYTAQGLPVIRGANPVVMVPGSKQAREQCQADNDIEPFFDDFPVDSGHLDQQVGQQGGHDKFPHAFHPQVHDPPPVQLVDSEITGVEEREQPEYGCQPKPQHQYQVDGCLAPFYERHAGIVEKHQE